MIDLKPATYELLRAYYGHGLGRSVKALAAVRGDEVLGVVGVYPADGRQVVFMDLKEELRRHPRVFVRGAKVVMQWVKEARMPTHAMCDRTIEAAERLLLHYGFQHSHRGLFVWAPPHSR